MMVLVLVMLTFARSLFEKLTGVCSSLGWLGWQKPTSGLRSCRLLKVDVIKVGKNTCLSKHSKEKEVNKNFCDRDFY